MGEDHQEPGKRADHVGPDASPEPGGPLAPDDRPRPDGPTGPSGPPRPGGAEPTQAEGGSRWLAVLILTVVGLSGYLTVIPVFGPLLQQHYAITNRQLGTLFACQTTGGLLALFLVVPAVNRLGVGRAVLLALLGSGVSYVAAGLGHSLVAFEASLMAIGVFGCALFVSGMSLLVELHPALRRRMVAISLAVTSVPSMVFPPAAQYALTNLVAPGRLSFSAALHAPMAAMGLLMLLAAAPLAAALSPRGQPARDDGERIHWRRLLTPLTALIVVLSGLHGGADTALYSWVPKFMSASFRHHPLPAGVVLAAYSVAYLVARSVQAALPEGFGQRLFLTLTGPIGGVIALAAIWRGGSLDVGILYPLAGLIWCLEYPALLVEIESGSARLFSGVLAAAQLSSYLFAVGQQNLVGWLADYTHNLRLAMTPLPLSFISFGVLAAISGLGRRRGADK